MKVKIICKTCNKIFYVYQSRILNQGLPKYCSVKCFKKRKLKEKIRIICKFCGKEFECGSSYKNRKYCSYKCHGLQRAKEGYIKKKCPNCKKTFYITKSLYKKGFGIFCNKKCRFEYTHITHTCEVCKKVFTMKLSQSKTSLKHYCSHKCFEKTVWKGGFEKSRKRALQSDKYIISKLKRGTILSTIDIPQELIDLKRAELQLHRTIKEVANEKNI